MKIFKVIFEPIYPVGGHLIIAAEDIAQAVSIAKETIYWETEIEVIEVEIANSGVISFASGDY